MGNAPGSSAPPPETAPHPWLRARKLGLLIGIAIVSINIWTGAPLLALWVGSKAQGDGGLTMATVAIVVACLALTVFLLAMGLAWLNERYDELIDRKPPPRQQYPWMRSMRAERELEIRRDRGVSGAEMIVVVSVVVAILALEIWFLFFANYTLPG